MSYSSYVIACRTMAASLAMAAWVSAPVAAAFVAPPLTDQSITDRVEDELLADQGVLSPRIDVVTTEGVVTLSGTVGNLSAKERALRIAETIRGVRAVVNRIEVRRIEGRSDAQVQRDVDSALIISPVVETNEVRAEVEDGVVTLKGEVDSYQERALVKRVVTGVSGVTKIDDRLTLNYKQDRTDAEIEEEVAAALRWNVNVDHFLLDVAVADGEVMLSGTVGSAAEKRLAETIAWVAGVKDVDSSALDVEGWARDPDRRRDRSALKPPGELKSAVESALLYDPRVNSFEIHVGVLGGTVTLRGKVGTLEARRAAEQDAYNTVGVNAVINRLKVRSEKQPPDSGIIDGVAAAFRRDPYIDRFQISVSSVDGTVYLYGSVDSYFEKRRADDVAAKVPGVVDVQNHLFVDFQNPHVFDPYVDDDYFDNQAVFGYDRRSPLKSDAQLKNDIEREIWWSPFVDSEDVTVSVHNGVAGLTGTVESWSERRAATENAYEGGATLVDNDLRVVIE